ncbi:4-(cytidine 5'-diphospho)-2-C-methyl-D-erythritol kinase [Bacteroides acidifaciens]|uniref:4-diphosphocytidyl-2-C-methyl-D-erythritol kinase n=1 Tax=Bacteroides acidifaciens TaxID=85831 RepID=A0A7I9ZXG5_9BACE|nr:4-(cytidine 5'-diphospho)-2-C-methyl-D-erythritol kinase [Bacteroides acidifaciens]MBF0729269.1 4-(cytidine 5'-diphospho)-2-C-methyl-D-erythritol kinase [Bacteroides acidifaciens]MBF0837410.1 4-(cytidine 5'-diphospho)-2-C-methyl-D-erythritol kinase [Bacteroides acidifaciens]NDO52702.1 4-(cytidine 5'-diphospho)-2-C-methyl-D-erythritol kinase [Bacteroides acidifaciens]TFU50526.1 4-(cytidine 5'-diphospho)-2-C-methyl-D-erythritol kinase [Bacteroides acidifaciens]GFH84835.1 4-diphosphocytidyl-2-
MIVFPNIKINLGLSITEKRPDGYHNLETVFYPVALEDALEIRALPEADKKITLHQYGMEITGNPEDNLVAKAYSLLDKEFHLPPVEIHLYKHIPSGAGLGGGSSDAAFMLKLLNGHFHLNLSEEQLEIYAATLGADCAFFIKNKPVYAEGIGNIFSPIELSLKGYQIMIVKPDVFVSTREAFANIHPHHPEYPVKEVIRRPVAEWKDTLINDFEASVFPQHPVIGEIKKELYNQGALYASMSGSGSSVFGLFAPDAALPEINRKSNSFCFKGTLGQ